MLLMLNVAIFIVRFYGRLKFGTTLPDRAHACESGPYNAPMTMLAELVETSRCVAGTSGRNAKVAALAALLKKLDPDEIAIAVAYLSGETPQGRSGVGYALLSDARPTGSVDVPTLSIADTDAALAALATTSGAGSKTARTRLLQALLERATEVERDFLTRLLIGELRQGALESLVIDAVAAAASLPASAVRSAAMVAHGVSGVARAALVDGAAGLAPFALELMQPVA